MSFSATTFPYQAPKAVLMRYQNKVFRISEINLRKEWGAGAESLAFCTIGVLLLLLGTCALFVKVLS